MKMMQIFIVLSCLGSMPLAAEENDSAAHEAFSNGTTSFHKGDFVEAADFFRVAYQMKKTWKLMYNIGQAEAAAKRYGLALVAFEQYLAEGGDDVPTERRVEVLSEVRRLRDMVGDLAVIGPDGATVAIDGVERGTLPLIAPLAVSAGVPLQATVTSSDGEILLDKKIRLRSSRVLELNVSTSEEAAGEVAKKDTGAATMPNDTNSKSGTDTAKKQSALTPEKKQPLKIAGIVVTGVGAASLIAGAITGGLALGKQGELDDLCEGGDCYGGNSQSLETDRDNMALMTDILIPVGGVLVTTGIVFLIVNANRNSEKNVSRGVRLLPVAGASMNGLLLEGSF